jgi:hypothetical protein
LPCEASIPSRASLAAFLCGVAQRALIRRSLLVAVALHTFRKRRCKVVCLCCQR